MGVVDARLPRGVYCALLALVALVALLAASTASAQAADKPQVVAPYVVIESESLDKLRIRGDQFTQLWLYVR